MTQDVSKLSSILSYSYFFVALFELPVIYNLVYVAGIVNGKTYLLLVRRFRNLLQSGRYVLRKIEQTINFCLNARAVSFSFGEHKQGSFNTGLPHAGFLKTTCLRETSTLFPGLPLP